jgi:hypothetical protein
VPVRERAAGFAGLGTLPASPRRSAPKGGSTIKDRSTAPSCVSWHGASTSTKPQGPCTSSCDSAVRRGPTSEGCRRPVQTWHVRPQAADRIRRKPDYGPSRGDRHVQECTGCHSGGVSRSRKVSAARSTPRGSRTTAIATAADRKMTGTAVTHGGRIIARASAARHLIRVVRSLVMTPGSLTTRAMYTTC